GLKKPIPLANLLKRPEIDYLKLQELDKNIKEIPSDVVKEIEIEIKYEGYIQKEKEEVRRLGKIEKIKIPADLDYYKISGLSREIREKLSKFKPLTLREASIIPGITPAAISLLWVYIQKLARRSLS
ncbi:MAG: tRNA uridine-5-carboxymethylaminomethyl(34) synthesis enzyme MnmG, partial [Candidatus Omnitrophica bacterium]|nr:tRNA uridine-5-carboxymethylaminomethyl(34) synthesis enzyme MnmG [Candidatus Omnitrophota bacterium]